MSKKIEVWQKAKQDVSNTIQWNDLPNGRKYENSRFNISISHCIRPKFIRAGQQTCGGKNYWETNEAFGLATLEYLANDWDTHFNGILKIMQEKEKDALLECQSYVDEMQKTINEA